MEYYRVCPVCGAHLDPGEKCDCQEADELEGYLREENDNVSA